MMRQVQVLIQRKNFPVFAAGRYRILSYQRYILFLGDKEIFQMSSYRELTCFRDYVSTIKSTNC